VKIQLPAQAMDPLRYRRPLVLRFSDAQIRLSTWGEGRFGQARRFHGFNRVSCQLPFVPGMNSSGFTVEFWARIQPKPTPQVLVARGPKDRGHWELWVAPGTGNLTCYTPGLDPIQVDSGVKVDDGNWHFIALRVKPGALSVSVDGKTTVDKSVTGKNENSSHPVVLGTLADGEFPLSGSIEGFRFSAGWRPLGKLPDAPLEKDSDTILLDEPAL
jgi:hypothetical protein